MNCMKCGREIAEGQVFCDGCLAEMGKYPVKPGTLVRLPERRSEPVGKKPHPRRKQAAAPEEQVKKLRRTLRRLIAALVVSLILLGVSGYFAVVHLLESRIVVLPGQNYSAIVSEETGEAE